MRVKASNLKFVLLPALVLLLLVSFSISAFAITESEVQAQVNAAGKESVTGSVLIWFLCAVAFMKVSQKIDSFMASLGVNVGHTGGSMLSEAIIATRAVSSAVNTAGRAFGGGRSGASGGASGGGSSGATSTGGFFSGGLFGIVSRAVTNSAVRTATESNSESSPVSSDVAREAVYAASQSGSGDTIHSPSQGQQGAAGGTSGVSGGGTPAPVPGTVDGTAPISVPGGAENNTPISTPGAADNAVPVSMPAAVDNATPISVPSTTDNTVPITVPNGDENTISVSTPGVVDNAAPLSMPDVTDNALLISTPGAADSIIPAATLGGAERSEPIVAARDAVGLAAEADSEENGAVPITVPADPGISLSMAAADGEHHSILVPSPAQDGGEGTVINNSAETDASTLEASTSENLSAALTNNAEQTIHAPGNPPLAESSGAPGGVTMVQQSETKQNVTTSKETVTHAEKSTHTASGHTALHTRTHGIGGAMFMKSLASGGSFANDIIGRVATGDIKTTGTISGEMASQAFTCYMGMNAVGTPPTPVPSYTDVEIGGGRITGIETAPGGQSIQFAMYHSTQYTAPQGDYTKVVSADGATWYKQYAQDDVDRKPYYAPDQTVAYKETIVQRMPNPPRRKDKM